MKKNLWFYASEIAGFIVLVCIVLVLMEVIVNASSPDAAKTKTKWVIQERAVVMAAREGDEYQSRLTLRAGCVIEVNAVESEGEKLTSFAKMDNDQ